MLEMTNDNADNAMPIVFEKARLNVFNLAGFAIVAMINVAGGAIVWTNLNRDVAEIRDAQQDRATVSDRNFADIRAQIQPIPQLRFQQDQQAVQIAELKAQMAALLERFGTKLDTLNDSVNSVRTEVRVLAQEVRSNAEKKAHPTGFTP
ncbi:Transmembrane protein [Shinella sp. WSC3-e]|nr:conserved hypothetical protein [Rhizobiaceae bacterium]CAK7259107.1 Transmembrane protein [Shinella sp. WSC3-e]